jgi:hypothetical protein
MADRGTALAFHNHAVTIKAADPVMAYRSTVAAVTADPGCADAWLLLAIQARDMGNEPAAIAACKAGLRCTEGDGPGDLNVALRHKFLVNLGHSLMNDGRYDEAFRVTDEAIRLWERVGTEALGGTQGVAFAFTNLSLIQSHQGLQRGVVENARRGFELFPDVLTEMGLAFALLFDGRYAEGLKLFEARFPYRLQKFANMPYPRWDGGKVGTLMIVPDQGLGDSLSFARFIPDAADIADRVIVMMPPELLVIMRGALASYANVEVVMHDAALPRADAWCPIMSLPVALGLSDDQIRRFDGLDAEAFAGGTVGSRLEFEPGTFNIAIAWAGAPANEIDKHRSIPVTEFLPLLEVPRVRLWSVQVGPRAKEMHDACCAAMMVDLSPYIRDASDTAGILRRMDLVVTIESFVAHLAGALDLPCWVAASKRGRDWRIGTTGETPLWYANTRIWRQGDDLSWKPVFAAMVEELRRVVDGTS